MAILTKEMNDQSKMLFQEKLNIDDYQIEYDFESSEKTLLYEDDGERRIFFPILVRWKVKGKRYSTLIKPIIIAKESGSWPFEYIRHEYNIGEMEKEAIKMINKTNKLVE